MEKIPVEILGLTTSTASSGAYALILKKSTGTAVCRSSSAHGRRNASPSSLRGFARPVR